MGFEPIYKASENEFSASSFHSACDGKGATITLIETTDGCVFGGYNSQSWNNDSKWYGDDKCFIFTLVNKHGIKPTKYSPGQDTHYVASNFDSGPIFGGGFDIGFDSSDGSSYQSFPYTYVDTTGQGKTTLTPTKSFKIKTIEIYKFGNKQNENDRLKQENKAIKQHLEKLSEENDNHNNKMDLLLSKIENVNQENKNYSKMMDILLEKMDSLINVNDKLNTKIENVNQENKKNVEDYSKIIELLSDKVDSLAEVNESLNIKIKNVDQQISQQQSTLIEQHHKSLEKIDSLIKANESIHQQLKQLHNSLDFKHLEICDKISKTCKEIESCQQDLLFLIYESKSTIIENASFKIINDWIDDSKTMGFELLYKASENEFSASSFHLACDGKGATITLIETTDGYCDNSKWCGDNKCFIFTLVNKHGIKPTKYSPGTKNTNYVGCSKNAGPIFGNGHDIGVNIKKGISYQNFPSTYIDTTGKGRSTLNPTIEFIIKTIEIYNVDKYHQPKWMVWMR
ncbi:hypothetical protein CYY_010144 [Polysphondylium violaceum]|uniref:TLDc domain-containing protein n=1 Tax=Polysphondylium violaceum TaxID=133409 RepID=A0A8J4PJD6_9MYCE|nr:hypothetical protein CYY_010144 [Polysphondylium violaceum]